MIVIAVFFVILSVSEESQFHMSVSYMKIRQVAPKGATCFFYIYMYVRVYARVCGSQGEN